MVQEAKANPAVRSTLLSAALCCNARIVKEYDEALKQAVWYGMRTSGTSVW